MNLEQGVKVIATELFEKVRLIGDIYHNKKRTGITLGVELKKVFRISLDIKITKKVAIVTFRLNDNKHRLYLATTKILTIVRSALTFIKGIICKDKAIIRSFDAISISKKEYKKMKLNAKNIKRDLKTAVKRNSRPIYIVYQDVTKIKRQPRNERLRLVFE